MNDENQSRFHEAMVLGFIWAVVGVLYSTILVAMLAFFREMSVGDLGIGLAAAAAGAVGALFYGSLRLAFLAAVSALIAAFGFLMAMPMQSISPLSMLLISGLAGVIVGAHYGYLMKGSRVKQATAKALAGLYSGFIAGMPLAAMAALFGEVKPGFAAATLTPLTGVIYVATVGRIIDLIRVQPPAILSGALVGGGVSSLTGIAVWAFAGIFSSTITGDATQAVRFAWSVLPQAVLGGMIGGFLAGAALAALSGASLQER